VSAKTCTNCKARFDGGMFDMVCPACRRQKQALDVQRESLGAQTAAAERASAAAERAAEGAVMQGRAALHQAQAQAQASLIRANAESQAREREAAAQVALLSAQGAAALADSVGHLSDEGVARVDAYEKLKLDREHIDKLFDELGNAVACIEEGGRDTPHYCVPAFKGEANGERNGISFFYRYQNLTSAMAKLKDLRVEVARIRNWDANQTREVVLLKIEEASTVGKRARREAAIKGLGMLAAKRREVELRRNVGIIGVCIAVAMIALHGKLDQEPGIWMGLIGFMILCLSGIFWMEMHETLTKGPLHNPIGLEDIQEAAEDA
jgi:hypothetical protein